MNSCHRGKTLIKLVNLTNSIYNLTTMAVELKKMASKLLTEELRRQGMLVGDHMNSAVNEIIRTISIFFKKCKIKYFTPLRTFSARKIVAFVVFCSPVFDLLVGFGLIYVFVRSRFFRKKKLVRNCLDNLIYHTTDVYPYQLTYRELFITYFGTNFFTALIYLYPCTLTFICRNLFLSVNNYLCL